MEDLNPQFTLQDALFQALVILVPAAVVGLAIGIAVYFAITLAIKRSFPRKGSQGSVNGEALDALRARYARGEMDGEEYRRMREELAE